MNMAIMSLSVWVPTDVDFVARFRSNCRFFRGNRRVSRIVLSGNTTGELKHHNDVDCRNEENKIINNKNSERADFSALF